MSRAKRLQPVLRIAELDAEKAARQLALTQQRIVIEQSKLAQLQDYQHEYRVRLQTAGQTGISVDKLRLFDGFHQQLDRAIEQQQQLILKIQQDQAVSKAIWQQKDIRFKSLQNLLERLQKDASVQQARIEQRNHDEYSRRRSGNNGWS